VTFEIGRRVIELVSAELAYASSVSSPLQLAPYASVGVGRPTDLYGTRENPSQSQASNAAAVTQFRRNVPNFRDFLGFLGSVPLAT
jgi:hypothetical protein